MKDDTTCSYCGKPMKANQHGMHASCSRRLEWARNVPGHAQEVQKWVHRDDGDDITGSGRRTGTPLTFRQEVYVAHRMVHRLPFSKSADRRRERWRVRQGESATLS